MKVILLQDVPKIGQRHDVTEVADGFAMNYLIPQRLAEAATTKKIDVLERRRVEDTEKAAKLAKELQENLQKVSGKKIFISAQANEQGHLFKGLRESDIAAAIEKEIGVKLPVDSLELLGPIKEIGEHTLTVSAGGEETTVTVSVEAEK